ncbi:uncharacterized protein LOC135658842 [Musa acuminata AAA Group]|uniref:uncharacterized protein LOC108951925 n=1 Tax=Musa acuminata AAA Group TaxID=214697 RepID=UPI0008A0E810|nr:PREDICTED: uncharacterized protein LOC108951925 [Musa acuminata subsp. malaccensis]
MSRLLFLRNNGAGAPPTKCWNDRVKSELIIWDPTHPAERSSVPFFSAASLSIGGEWSATIPFRILDLHKLKPIALATSPAYIKGGCIADIGSCETGFDSASGSVQTKTFRTKGSELADRKGEKNKAMPRAPEIRCSSRDSALSLASRARCNKRLILLTSRKPRERPASRTAKLICG